MKRIALILLLLYYGYQDLRQKDADDRQQVAEETKKMENELRMLREKNEQSLKEEGELAAQLLSL